MTLGALAATGNAHARRSAGVPLGYVVRLPYDNFSDFSISALETYAAMVKRFESGNFSGLVTVTVGEDVTKGAINFFDGEFCLCQIVEKPSAQQVEGFQARGLLKKGDPVWYNAGIYMFKPVLFDFTARLQTSPRGEYELPDAISAMLIAGHKVAGCKIEGRWVDVRDPEVLAELEKEK